MPAARLLVFASEVAKKDSVATGQLAGGCLYDDKQWCQQQCVIEGM